MHIIFILFLFFERIVIEKMELKKLERIFFFPVHYASNHEISHQTDRQIHVKRLKILKLPIRNVGLVFV